MSIDSSDLNSMCEIKSFVMTFCTAGISPPGVAVKATILKFLFDS